MQEYFFIGSLPCLMCYKLSGRYWQGEGKVVPVLSFSVHCV
jgi:hypothetical protein